MDLLALGNHYCLHLPDGRTLGHIWVESVDDLWTRGSFRPALAFEEYRSLFERESELEKDQVIPLWEEAADAIAGLQIQVIENGQDRFISGL